MGCVFARNKGRNLSKVGQVDLAADMPQDLTETQKAVIKNNWHVLNTQISNVGLFTFISMFESMPELIETFAMFKGKSILELHTTGLLRKHALRVMGTIDKCITRLDQRERMAAILHTIGGHHKKYNVPIEYLEVILPHFLGAIRPHIEECWCFELQEAWTQLFSIILYHMREGMMQPEDWFTDKNIDVIVKRY